MKDNPEVTGPQVIYLTVGLMVALIAGIFISKENPVWFTEHPEQREIRRQNEWEVRYSVHRGHKHLE